MRHLLRALFAVCALSMPFHAQSMHSQILKTFLNRMGTFCGIGIATAPFLTISGSGAYCNTQNGNKWLMQFILKKLKCRNPSIEEDSFLRLNAHIKKETQLHITENCSVPGLSVINAVIISECLPGFQKSLSEAIEDRDEHCGACYIAVAQHENGHKENYHSLKKTVFLATVPMIGTALATNVYKIVVPYNPQASLGSHAVRCMTKILGGSILFLAHLKVFSLYKEYQEYQADWHVEPKYRSYLVHTLEEIQLMLDNSKNKSSISGKTAWREWLFNDHPTYEQRAKALGVTRGQIQFVRDNIKTEGIIAKKTGWRDWLLNDPAKRSATLGLVRDEPKQS